MLLRVDQLVLATFSNAHNLGVYAAAVKIAEVPNFIAGSIYATLVSRIAVATIENNALSKSDTRKMMYYYLAIGGLIAVLVVLFAPLLVTILYGSKFIETTSVLKVYAFSIPANFLFFFFFGVYGAREAYSYQIMIFVTAILINILLIYLLTPLLGLPGTAFSTVVSYSFEIILFYLHSKKSGFIL